MLMSVSSAENAPLPAKEFNKSGSYFVLFNQKIYKTHYREYLEKQDDDAFDSTCTRISTENTSTANDHKLDVFCMLMDLKQPPAKVVSKMKVMLLTSNWKTSNTISCVEVHYCTTVQ